MPYNRSAKSNDVVQCSKTGVAMALDDFTSLLIVLEVFPICVFCSDETLVKLVVNKYILFDYTAPFSCFNTDDFGCPLLMTYALAI